MKIGKNSKLTDLTISYVSSVDEDSGMYANNITDPDSLNVYQVTEGTVALSMVLPAVIKAELICLFNVTIEDDITINLIDTSGPTTISTITVNVDDLPGFEFKNVLFANTAPAVNFDKIEIITNGTTPNFVTSIGFLWAGDLIDFGCSEALQPADNSNDSVTLTRTNRPDAQNRYLYQSYQITTSKRWTFSQLQGKMRELFTLGIGTARPVILDEPMFNPTNLLYGILDAGTVKYDQIYIDDAVNKHNSQTTIGINEVT